MTEGEAKDWLAKFGGTALASLGAFERILRVEATKQNLIAESTHDSLWTRHFVDSAQLADYVPRETSNVLDLGSGAGLPGIVLAIIRPELTVVLVESRKLRITWLERAVAELGLENASIEGRSIASVPTFPAGAITARAFASLQKTLAWAGRFSTPDTAWVLPKGRSAAQELAEAGAKARKLFHVEQSIIDPESGILVGRGQFP